MGAIIGTALLSAILTAGLSFALAYYVYLHHIQPQFQRALEERLAELGDVIEDRVRSGVVRAVEDVASPESFQKRMSKGQSTFMDAIFGQRGQRDD